MAASQMLIFDGDDTLWENNVFYEKIIDWFIDHVDHPTLSRVEVRAALDDVERRNAPRYGYGAAAFQRSLGECLARLRGDGRVGDADREQIARMCALLHRRPVELIEGAAATVATLAERHTLFLLTKGDQTEQRHKVDNSGLAHFFDGVFIVPEKDSDVYRGVVRDRGLDPERTWMIGNSPRSDVLPALEAGIGAVHIPHPMTWSLEQAELPAPDGRRFLTVSPISGLLAHF